MADDWDTVTVLRKRAPNKATMKSESAVNQVSNPCLEHLNPIGMLATLIEYFEDRLNIISISNDLRMFFLYRLVVRAALLIPSKNVSRPYNIDINLQST